MTRAPTGDRTDGTGTCGAAVQRMVESGGRPLDPATEEHVRSCMSCFRAMTDLRELPRVAEALREAAPPVPADDRFWEALARRTTDAVAAALDGVQGPPRAEPAPAPAPAAAAVPRPPVRWRSRLVSVGALALAAAAGWLVMVRRPAPVPGAPVPSPAIAARAAGPTGADDGSGEALNEVADLDAGALRRLLAQMGRQAPAALAGDTSDGTDAADVPADDEPRVSDEVAELDGDALRRVARSLDRGAL
jgi:hypothetical protein